MITMVIKKKTRQVGVLGILTATAGPGLLNSSSSFFNRQFAIPAAAAAFSPLLSHSHHRRRSPNPAAAFIGVAPQQQRLLQASSHSSSSSSAVSSSAVSLEKEGDNNNNNNNDGSISKTTESALKAAAAPGDAVLDEPSVVAQRVFATDKRPIILFDGVCNLCNGAVNLALDWDPKGRLRFAALQSNVGQALLQAKAKRAPDDISSIVLVTDEENGAYVKSDAILRITEALSPIPVLKPIMKPAARLGRYVVPRFLRDLIYDGVANNRYDLMGKQDYCRFDADREFEDRFVNDDLALKMKQ